ncbi:MAG: MerC domain-containing protein [Bacteroidota bacterium]
MPSSASNLTAASARAATNNHTLWDRLGIGLSGLCALHCLLTPVLLAMLPLWTGLGEIHEWVHIVLVIPIIPITIIAMRNAAGPHRSKRVPWYLGVGLVLIIVAIPLGHELGGPSETLITLAGSGLLISGHWMNWRLHKNVCTDDDHTH